MVSPNPPPKPDLGVEQTQQTQSTAPSAAGSSQTLPVTVTKVDTTASGIKTGTSGLVASTAVPRNAASETAAADIGAQAASKVRDESAAKEKAELLNYFDSIKYDFTNEKEYDDFPNNLEKLQSYLGDLSKDQLASIKSTLDALRDYTRPKQPDPWDWNPSSAHSAAEDYFDPRADQFSAKNLSKNTLDAIDQTLTKLQ